MKKKISLLICLVMIMQLFSAGFASAAKIGTKTITSKGACVMDFETGEVYYEFNGNKARVPASMTKIMNVYLIYEALENGLITLDTVVPISKNVYEKSRNSVYQSVLPLYYNKTYTVDQMLDVIVVYSASGAAVAMAELLGGGSEAEFVKKMNAKATELGVDAYYKDSCGIATNEITPIGMAKLARQIIKDYPDILKRSSQKSVKFHGNTYKTTNHLLDTYYYEGADGLKTGTTSQAGYCFCGTAVRNGRRMISVTMSSASTGQRFVDTATLLDYGFEQAEKRVAAQPSIDEILEKNNSIYYTDIRTFINENEVPTFLYDGVKTHPVIIAEDLARYGFDVTYDEKAKMLLIKHNPNKKPHPIDMSYYRGKNGEKAYSIIPERLDVVVSAGELDYFLTDVYNVNGYICISVDELKKMYNFEWKDSERASYISPGQNSASSQITVSGEARAILPNGEELTSGSAYIMDFESGKELYSFNADTQKAVASIAKMMSIYVILDAVKNGEIALDTVVPISENVYNLSRVEDYKMMVNLEYDEVYTVDEMIDMIIIDSAAACVTAVAELISGSEEEFVKRMNKKAEEIGIGSVFYNGTGVCLNPAVDKENLMSAREVAIMTKKMIEDYPDVLERTKEASVVFHGKTYYNLNKMFTDYYYEGADGFKNGMTPASGYCMCGTAIRDGKRVITVTLPSNSNEARFTDTAKMFDYGFTVLGVEITNDKNENPNEPVYKDGEDVKINIDGNYEMNFAVQKPVIIDGRAMIPVRELLETLEKKVDWNDETKQAIISDEATTVKLSAGNNIMIKEVKNPLSGEVTFENVKLEVAPVIVNGRILLPIRAVVEAFGMAVIWEEDTRTILIIAGVC